MLRSFVASCALALLVPALTFGCSKSDAKTDPSPRAATKSDKTTDTPAAEKAGKVEKTEKTEPLSDFGSIAASCETKSIGECVEYKELGLLGDVVKEGCGAIKGTYSTSARCPKEGRVAVCSTETKKRFIYKSYFELMKPEEAKKSCADLDMGTWADYPKN